MAETVLKKYPWVDRNFFESALRREFVDDSIAVASFEISQEITKRTQSFWCDVVKVEINFQSDLDVRKYETS